jgi:hypothetical protein
VLADSSGTQCWRRPHSTRAAIEQGHAKIEMTSTKARFTGNWVSWSRGIAEGITIPGFSAAGRTRQRPTSARQMPGPASWTRRPATRLTADTRPRTRRLH